MTNSDNTQKNLPEKFNLAHRLINTLQSKVFKKSLTGLWVGAAKSDNIYAIQEKAQKEVVRKVALFERLESYECVYAYLDSLAGVCGVKLKKADTKGLKTSMSTSDYVLLEEFIYHLSAARRPEFDQQNGQFQCHELLWLAAQYLMIKDSVENGTGIHSLDAIIEKMITLKPVMFFKHGHLTDVFVHDRVCLSKKQDKKVTHITSHKSYLSTRSVTEDVDLTKANMAEIDVYKVA